MLSVLGPATVGGLCTAAQTVSSLSGHVSDVTTRATIGVVRRATTAALEKAVDMGVARASVAVDPNSKLPGTLQLTSLVGGLMTWVLLACVAAVLIGAATWGFGSRSGHFGATQQGRTMVLGGVAGAMITGAATALVNFGFGIGGAVH